LFYDYLLLDMLHEYVFNENIFYRILLFKENKKLNFEESPTWIFLGF